LGPGKIELILKILRARTLQNKLNLLDQVRDVTRRGHFSIRTEEAYTNWARKGFAHAPIAPVLKKTRHWRKQLARLGP
jgi:hypothetical protein